MMYSTAHSPFSISIKSMQIIYSRNVKSDVCSMFMALLASKASMTQEMLISDAPCEIISRLMLFSPSVLNMRLRSVASVYVVNAGTLKRAGEAYPAIPIMFFISAPTKLRIAILCSIDTSPHSSSSARVSCICSSERFAE